MLVLRKKEEDRSTKRAVVNIRYFSVVFVRNHRHPQREVLACKSQISYLIRTIKTVSAQGRNSISLEEYDYRKSEGP